jgi:(p)ppGpp synthase/HD superfamily hydrolase
MDNGLRIRSMEFASSAHQGQVRKSSGKPYIVHPFRVAQILENAGMPLTVIIAGDNHDTVEDTSVTIALIYEEFGDEVAELVAFNTEDKERTWEERKTHTIEHLKTGTLHQKALVVADKYANLLELSEDIATFGEDIWKSFNRGKLQQEWYFSGVATSAMENLQDGEIPAFFHEYKQLVDSFFGLKKV